MATQQNGRWKASIGYHVVDGERRPKVFELGKDERAATLQEQCYRHWWNVCRNQQPKGAAVWTDAYLRTADTLAKQAIGMTAAAFQTVEAFNTLAQSTPREDAPTVPSTAAPKVFKKLHAVMDDYTAWVANQKQKSESYRIRVGEVMSTLKSVKTDTIPTTNVEVAGITRMWVDQLTQHFKNRPPKIVRTWRTLKDEDGNDRKVEVRRAGAHGDHRGSGLRKETVCRRGTPSPRVRPLVGFFMRSPSPVNAKMSPCHPL